MRRLALPIALVALAFLAELALLHGAARGFRGPGLPLAPIDPHRLPHAIPLAWLGLAAVQSVALFRIATAPREAFTPPVVALVAVVAVVMIGAAAALDAITSNDIYAYLGYGELSPPRLAYAPPLHALAPPFRVVETLWGDPLLPCIYGPLWLGLVHVVLLPVHAVPGGLVALRAVGVVMLGLALLALRFARVPAPVVAAFALNPAFALEFVTNAHNDIVALVPVLWGVALVMRDRRVAGVALAALGGLAKMPIAIAAVAAVADGGASRARRIGEAVVMLAVAALGTLAYAGPAFLAAVATVNRAYTVHAFAPRLLDAITHWPLALVALALAALAVVAGRHPLRSGGLAFTAVSKSFYPNYLAWGVPYALRVPGALGLTLAAFPLLDALFTNAFPGSGTVARVVILAVIGAEIARRAPRGAQRVDPLAAAP